MNASPLTESQSAEAASLIEAAFERDPALAEWWEQQCRERQAELDRALAAAKPEVPEGALDRTWDRITETIRADEGALHVPQPEDGGITGTCERWHPAASHDSSPGAVAVTAPGGGGVTA